MLQPGTLRGYLRKLKFYGDGGETHACMMSTRIGCAPEYSVVLRVSAVIPHVPNVSLRHVCCICCAECDACRSSICGASDVRRNRPRTPRHTAGVAIDTRRAASCASPHAIVDHDRRSGSSMRPGFRSQHRVGQEMCAASPIKTPHVSVYAFFPSILSDGCETAVNAI